MSSPTTSHQIDWPTVFAEQAPRIERLARQLFFEPLDAEDIVQETFEKAVKYQHKFDPNHPSGASFGTYVYQIALNTCRGKRKWIFAQCRHNRAGADLSLDRLMEAGYRPRTGEPNPEDVIAETDQIQGLLGPLSLSQRQVVEMYYFQGMGATEIGQQRGIHRNSVHALIRRGLATAQGGAA